MTLSDAKEYVLYEVRREKRITLRNLIIVVVLILVGIFLGVKYMLPIISQQITNVPTYVKFVLPLALLLSAAYPLMRVWKILKRGEQVEEAFSLISQGEECRIVSETDDYLTVIPYGKRSRIQMDPISYLGVSIKNKTYTFVNLLLRREISTITINNNQTEGFLPFPVYPKPLTIMYSLKEYFYHSPFTQNHRH